MSALGNTTLSAQIDSFANDGKINVQEKRVGIQAWTVIFGTTGADGEYQLMYDRATILIAAGNASLTAKLTALTNAYGALKTYVEGLTGLFDVSAADVTVDNSVWDAKWKAYYVSYADIDAATSSISDVGVGLASGLVDDGVITAGKEKQQLISLYNQFVSEQAAMQTKAAIGVGVSTAAYDAAFDALETYLFGLFTDEAGFLDDQVGSTSVNYAVYTTKFQAYYDAREALENAILTLNFANIQRDSAAIPSMALDGTITSDEKYTAQVYWNTIYGTANNGEYMAVYTQADALFSAGEKTTYLVPFTNAFTQLWNLRLSGKLRSWTQSECPQTLRPHGRNGTKSARSWRRGWRACLRV
jgi:hypothetical protein